MAGTSDEINERARQRLIRLLEAMRADSPYAGKKMNHLSIAIGASPNVYGNIINKRHRLATDRLRRICDKLGASHRQIIATGLLLVAMKWDDAEIAALILRLSKHYAKIPPRLVVTPPARGAPARNATPPDEAIGQRRRG